MTWTYVPPDGSGDLNRDKVRLLIGDTNTNDQLLSDEELCFLEVEFGSATDIYSTALAAIDLIIVELSRKPTSKSVGPLSLSYADRLFQMGKARARVQALAMRKAAPTPYAGGTSVADKEIDEGDDDVPGHWAQIGGFDNPGASDERDLTDVRDRDDL
jgi:hypothetical protein